MYMVYLAYDVQRHVAYTLCTLWRSKCAIYGNNYMPYMAQRYYFCAGSILESSDILWISCLYPIRDIQRISEGYH